MRAATVHALVLLGACAGLVAAVYAGYESTHPALQGSCTITAFFSCAAVDQSGYTTVLGIQDYWVGIGGFLLLLALDIPLYRTWKRPWLLAVTGVSLLGLGFAAYFAYVELALIHAFCLVCFASYVADAVVAAGALYLVRSSTRAEADGPPSPG